MPVLHCLSWRLALSAQCALSVHGFGTSKGTNGMKGTNAPMTRQKGCGPDARTPLTRQRGGESDACALHKGRGQALPVDMP